MGILRVRIKMVVFFICFTLFSNVIPVNLNLSAHVVVPILWNKKNGANGLAVLAFGESYFLRSRAFFTSSLGRGS